MAVSLAKGGSVSLTKEAGSTGLRVVTVGLGWDVRSDAGAAYDLDLSAILLNSSGRAVSDENFVFYNNATSPDGAVRYSGDNRTGAGDGDDETMLVDLSAVASGVQSVVIIASIDNAASLGHSFGGVLNAYIRVVSNTDNRELARFDLTDGADTDVALAFGELYRDGGEWKFQAVGDGFPGGLAAALDRYGIDAG
jgi:tellurium resistance protein TerD